MAVKVGINGFGRIGRNIFRTSLGDPEIDFVAVNDITDTKTLAQLLKYDSVLEKLEHDMSATANGIRVEDEEFRVFSERDPAKIDWESVGAQIVIESTGLFTKAEDAKKHLRGSVKKVIISAPAKGEDITLVLGVNADRYDPAQHHVISNASCTTNCLATAVKPIVDSLGWRKGFMSTIHSYTNDQNILDAPHKDLRRARNAATNIIPTSSGAAKALFLTIPQVQGTFDGFALRVPTPTVSLVYLVAQVRRETTKDEVNAILRRYAEGEMKEYVGYTDEELVSSDFKGSSYSSIVDAKLTNVNGDLVQLCAWYDNEWGYSCRLADLGAMVLERIPAKA